MKKRIRAMLVLAAGIACNAASAQILQNLENKISGAKPSAVLPALRTAS